MEKTYSDTNGFVKRLKDDFEAGIIKQEDMSCDEVSLLCFVYQLEILDLDDNIDKQKQVLAEYKERLKNAIEYLKSKNVSNS